MRHSVLNGIEMLKMIKSSFGRAVHIGRQGISAQKTCGNMAVTSGGVIQVITRQTFHSGRTKHRLTVKVYRYFSKRDGLLQIASSLQSMMRRTCNGVKIGVCRLNKSLTTSMTSVIGHGRQ